MDRLGVRVEQAMLGAILSDPAGQPQVLDWVEPSDMCRPWHGQVLGAMQRLRRRGIPPGPLEVYAELQNDPDLPASVRQRMRLAGSRMAQAGGAGDLGAALRLAGHARAELGASRVRWLALPERL